MPQAQKSSHFVIVSSLFKSLFTASQWLRRAPEGDFGDFGAALSGAGRATKEMRESRDDVRGTVPSADSRKIHMQGLQEDGLTWHLGRLSTL